MSRIDSFLVTLHWEEIFPDVSQMCFVRPIFKHVPLLLDSGGVQGSKVLFRFENMQLKVNGFVEMVKGLVAWLL